MVEGVEDSAYFILLLTREYERKVNLRTGRPENCNLEYSLALTKKGVEKMIVILRDATMYNPREWEGKIGFCGANLYIDGIGQPLDVVVEEVLKRLKMDVRKIDTSINFTTFFFTFSYATMFHRSHNLTATYAFCIFRCILA